MHDRLVSRRIDALHQCFLVSALILVSGVPAVTVYASNKQSFINLFKSNVP